MLRHLSTPRARPNNGSTPAGLSPPVRHMPPPPTTTDETYRPNLVLEWLYERFFAQIEVDPAWVRAVRDASARGAVVHVMRTQSYLDFVALDFFLKKFSLAPLRFVADTNLGVLEPMGRGLRRLTLRDHEPEE